MLAFLRLFLKFYLEVGSEQLLDIRENKTERIRL